MSFYNPNNDVSATLAAMGIVRSPGSQVFYVGNYSKPQVGGIGGSDGNSGLSPQEPFSTLSKAISSASSGRGDVIFVLPGHLENITASLSVNVDGLAIVGTTGKIPQFNCNGAFDMFNVTGSGVTLANLYFTISNVDAATAFVNVDGSFCTLKNLLMIPSTSGSINVVDVITVTSNATALVIDGCKIFNSATPVNSFLSIEGAANAIQVKDSFFFGDVVAGGVIDSATAGQMFWDNVTIGVVGTTKAAIVLDNNPTGLLQYCHFSGTSTTLASNANYGNALRLFECRVLEETNASAQGAVIPALDVD